MATPIFATSAPFEVVGSRKNHVFVVVQIKIFVIGMETKIGQCLLNFRENCVGIVQFVRNPCHRLKTRATQARRFETISRQTTEDMVGDNDLMTPARPLVKMPLGHSAAVVPAAEGTLFISA